MFISVRIYRFILTLTFFSHTNLDIEECGANNGGCSQVCVDRPGTHECRCMKGYKLQEDKKTCEGKSKSRNFSSFTFFYYRGK